MQLYCGCTLLLTTGAGFGGGMTIPPQSAPAAQGVEDPAAAARSVLGGLPL